jgi:hypothetical protein
MKSSQSGQELGPLSKVCPQAGQVSVSALKSSTGKSEGCKTALALAWSSLATASRYLVPQPLVQPLAGGRTLVDMPFWPISRASSFTRDSPPSAIMIKSSRCIDFPQSKNSIHTVSRRFQICKRGALNRPERAKDVRRRTFRQRIQ